jgi:hypothetical protein
MKRIGGEEHTGETEFGDQRGHSGNFARRRRDLLVCQDQRGVAGERAQHVRGRLIDQMVEATPQRLAVQRDGAPALYADLLVEVMGMAAESGFEIDRIEREEEIAQGVDRRSAPEVGTKGGVQALPVNRDEGDDMLVRGRPGEHCQH